MKRKEILKSIQSKIEKLSYGDDCVTIADLQAGYSLNLKQLSSVQALVEEYDQKGVLTELYCGNKHICSQFYKYDELSKKELKEILNYLNEFE